MTLPNVSTQNARPSGIENLAIHKNDRELRAYVQKPSIRPHYAKVKKWKTGMLNLNAPAHDERTIRANENQRSSPFLRLPSEVQQMIFAWVFEGQNIYINYPVYNFWGNRRHVRVVPAAAIKKSQWWMKRTPYMVERLTLISQVCRHFYHGTAHLPFVMCNFIFRSYYAFVDWSRGLRTYQRRALANLYLPTGYVSDEWSPSSPYYSQRVAQFTGIKKLFLSKYEYFGEKTTSVQCSGHGPHEAQRECALRNTKRRLEAAHRITVQILD